MIEWYQAYSDHVEQMDQTEELLRHLADSVLGTRAATAISRSIWTSPSAVCPTTTPWNNSVASVTTTKKPSPPRREIGLDPKDFATYDRLANEVWEEIVEPHLIEPTFITDQPTWLTPLCRTHTDDPTKTRRFELFVAKMELGNAYSELNDPDIQRQRFDEQISEAEAAKDDEAGVADGQVDDDYCAALDHGLPATGGEGMGVDRLVMLFTGKESIRDVILFPTKPEGE